MFNVTASIGYATFDQAPESTLEALIIADKTMYEAKVKGKNCTEVLATPEEFPRPRNASG